jgi:transposase
VGRASGFGDDVFLCPSGAAEAPVRICMHQLQELVRLHRMGTGAREVARLLGVSPNTERDYREALETAGVLTGSVEELPSLEALRAIVAAAKPPATLPQQVSSVERWTEIATTMVERGAGAKAIFDYLKVHEPEFGGSEWAIKRLVKRLNKTRGVRAKDVAIPVSDTVAGEIAQVDFGFVGKLFDPHEKRMRKAYVFVMVLSHSRRMVTRLVFDQKATTWLLLHIEAFLELGGVPMVVVPDNLKAAVIRAAFRVDDPSELNKSYRELARYYGFKVDPTPPFSPEKKGKVESGVKYVKNNFFATCTDEDGVAVRAGLQRWTDEIANVRVHGTTRRRPIDVFVDEERAALQVLPAKQFELVTWSRARVHRDAHVIVGRGLYSVPWTLIGQDVEIRATPAGLTIFFQDGRVATHDRVKPGKRSTIEEHLPPERRNHRQRNRAYWEDKARAIGDAVGTWVGEAFDSDDVLYQLRVVQNVILHLEGHPKDRANNACRRASYFGCYTYGGVKEILKKALDMEPLPTAERLGGEIQKHRYARNIAELLGQLPLEIPQ